MPARSTLVKITCATEGASIAYTTESGDKPHWLLYSQAVILDRAATLRAKAIRLGYKESRESQGRFEIGG